MSKKKSSKKKVLQTQLPRTNQEMDVSTETIPIPDSDPVLKIKQDRKAKYAILKKHGNDTGKKGKDSSMDLFTSKQESDTEIFVLDHLDERLVMRLKKLHDKRLIKGFARIADVHNILITFEDGLEVQGDVHTKDHVYTCLIARGSRYCSCRDHSVRKSICKHMIAVILSASEQKLITELDVASLLIVEVKQE